MSPPSKEPTAASITVQQTLDLLDGEFAAFAGGVADGRYAFWLGSGISRGRVPDLGEIVLMVLEFLQTRIDPGNPDCAHAKALAEAVDLAGLRDDERRRLNLAEPVRGWELLDVIVKGLVSRYAELLDVRVSGQREDYLVWDAVDVRATYPPDAPPDCEHYCIAILSLEGLVADLASANWDGLIESAVAELAGDRNQVLRVVVLAEDFREPARRTRLLKLHGCAPSAALDPTKYRGAIVAAQSQITSWPTDADTAVMRDALQTLATTKPTVMIGLSAQDSNLQDLFARATGAMKWQWPSDPPAHVFAGDALGAKQRNLLKVVYSEEYEEHGEQIERDALLRAYAQQLLTALVLHVLVAKLRVFIDTAEAPGLKVADRDSLGGGLRVLRDLAAAEAEPNRLAFVGTLMRAETRAMSLFQEGTEPTPDAPGYRPLSSEPEDQIQSSPSLPTSGLRELAAALGLLGRGSTDGAWHVSVGPTVSGNNGTLKVVGSTGVETAIYFGANRQAAVQSEMNARIDATADDVVMIHSTGPVGALARSPRRRFGRTGRGGTRHVDMSNLLKTSADLTDLEIRFRQGAAL